MKIKGFLFDLDGTLANTLPLCIKVYQAAFQRYGGRPYTEEEVTAHFGLTEAGIFKRVIPEHWEEGLEYYHELYESWHAECSEPFVGIDKALALLKQRNVKMGIVTGKGMHTAAYTLKYLGLAPYFSLIEAGQEQKAAKAESIRKILTVWQMQSDEAAYIGDTDSDMKEAAEAGVLPLAAAWAETSTTHLLKTLEPFATFTTVDKFSGWIDQYIEPNNAD